MSLGSFNTGWLTRKVDWQGEKVQYQSESEVSVLGISTHYQQSAVGAYHTGKAQILTQHFQQKMSGIKNRYMKVTLSHDGGQSEVILNGDAQHYHSDIPLRDIDTIGGQIRLHLIEGKSQFRLVRQATKEVEAYEFNVAPEKSSVTLDNHGDVEVIKVNETLEGDVTLWFAPSLDYHLVKAESQGFLLNGYMTLSKYDKKCD